MSAATNVGRSSPLGATVVDGAVNFSLFSRTASGADLLFFDREEATPSRVVRLDPATNRTYHYWIADVYSSTEEIKANGQVIVGLLHVDVGHLGIFVSGRVAKKEHAQIVEVLEHIETLRPGLYVMEIHEGKDASGKSEYEATIEERRLEDVRRLNRLERRDEKPFEVVAEVSTLSEPIYSLFVRPFTRPLVNEGSAELRREFHPLRLQRWALSDLNPWMHPVAALASAVKADRKAPDNPFRQADKGGSEAITAGLDLYRDLRDATMEALFFAIYGPAAVLGMGEGPGGEARSPVNPRELPLVQDALAAIGTGGYPEAMALIGALIARGVGRIPLARLELVDRFIQSDEVLSRLGADAIRRIKAELEPERGLLSLRGLLADPEDRQRALAVLDKAVAVVELTPEQGAMLDRARRVLTP